MMKMITGSLVVLLIFSPLVYAGYSDGLISAGEYESGVEWFSGTLVVNGGGADEIWARNSSRLKVLSTSSPLGLEVGGLMDIKMDNFSYLEYSGGLTQELWMYKNAIANLYGGRIDGISSVQYTVTTGADPHINIYCQEGWSWILDGTQKKVGITGLWLDNTTFNIHFTANGESHGYDPVWTNINVITPEPATLFLLGIGGLLIRRKK
jgi:hypothetical protein